MPEVSVPSVTQSVQDMSVAVMIPVPEVARVTLLPMRKLSPDAAETVVSASSVREFEILSKSIVLLSSSEFEIESPREDDKETLPPKETNPPPESPVPAVIVSDELVNDEFPILVIVLPAPDIVLFDIVCA